MRRPRYEPAVPISEVVGRKSHYIIARWGNGFAITVKRHGKRAETIMCKTPGEVNRLRAALAAEGLIGINGEIR